MITLFSTTAHQTFSFKTSKKLTPPPRIELFVVAETNDFFNHRFHEKKQKKNSFFYSSQQRRVGKIKSRRAQSRFGEGQLSRNNNNNQKKDKEDSCDLRAWAVDGRRARRLPNKTKKKEEEEVLLRRKMEEEPVASCWFIFFFFFVPPFLFFVFSRTFVLFQELQVRLSPIETAGRGGQSAPVAYAITQRMKKCLM